MGPLAPNVQWLLFVPYVVLLHSSCYLLEFYLQLPCKFLLMACTVTLLHDIVLRLLQLHLFFSTEVLGLYFILVHKCKDMKIQLPCSIRIIFQGQCTFQSSPGEQAETRLCNLTRIWLLSFLALFSPL